MKKLRRASPAVSGTGPLSNSDLADQEPHRPTAPTDRPPDEDRDDSETGTPPRRRTTTGFLGRDR